MSNADLIARLEAMVRPGGFIRIATDTTSKMATLLRESAAVLAAQEEEIDLRKFDVGMRDREIARLTSALQERDAEIALLREAKALGLTDRAPTAEDMAWAGQSALDLANAEIARLQGMEEEREACAKEIADLIDELGLEGGELEVANTAILAIRARTTGKGD